MYHRPIHFLKLDAPYGCLSNFSRHTIYREGVYWPTAEHYYQASKFDPSQQPKHRRRIASAGSPSEAKRLGRTRDIPIRENWDEARVDVMRGALRAKVAQHADVRAVLISTAPAPLVQRMDFDSFWGDGEDGQGRNMLGLLWVEIREELGGSADALHGLVDPWPPPWEKHPDIPAGSIGWRMGAGELYMADFQAFWNGLTPAGREKYAVRFPAPDGWESFYD